MIFLVVGNWHKGFDRLVKAVDTLVDSGIINEEVVAQIGYSSYEPKHMKVMDFCSPDKFVELVSASRIIVSPSRMRAIGRKPCEIAHSSDATRTAAAPSVT